MNINYMPKLTLVVAHPNVKRNIHGICSRRWKINKVDKTKNYVVNFQVETLKPWNKQRERSVTE